MGPVTKARIRLVLLATLVAAALPILVAWAWAYLYFAHSFHENTATFTRAADITSTIETIDIVNNHYPGVRWISIAGWPPGMTGSRSSTRSDPGEPYDSDPTYPWPHADVLPGLADPTLWPTPACGRPIANTNTGVTLVQMEAMGWPFYCVQGRADWSGATVGGFTMRGLIFTKGFKYNSWARQGRQFVLCSTPMWPGYALDSLIYAALLIPLALWLSNLRRRIRGRRGLCKQCGYDLRGLERRLVCPECGQIPARR